MAFKHHHIVNSDEEKTIKKINEKQKESFDKGDIGWNCQKMILNILE